MAVVNVIAEVEGEEYTLSTTDNTSYETEISAPQETTDISVTAIDENGNVKTVTEELNVGYEWLPPKTDWVATDYFNYVDYNRIINNIRYLRNLANKLFLGISRADLGEEKTYLSMFYAREMNNIESSLEILNLETYDFDIGEKTEYRENGSTPLYSEFNRIESAILLIYNTMTSHKEALPRLAFNLGGQKGIKV